MSEKEGASLAERWQRFAGVALFGYLRLVIATCRLRVEGWQYVREAEASGRPLLWTLWHGQVMLFVAFGDRFLPNEEFAVIIVGDERGNTLNSLATHFGSMTYKVDMEGNPVAAGRAVLNVVKALQAGRQTLLAPDGPDGPAYAAKPGVAFLARKAEAAVLPLGIWTRQSYSLNRWDRYLVPYPFARIHVAVGPPIFARRKDDDEALTAQIAAALHQSRHRAQVLAGVRPWR